jgi:3-hydroxyisobutyrate dehydrogenase-like beta-hydroxyacid dehydrogenase
VQFENRVRRMRARDFKPGGMIAIAYKDHDLVTSFAKHLGVPLLLANLPQQIYQMVRRKAVVKKDGSVIIKVFEELAGVEIGEGE